MEGGFTDADEEVLNASDNSKGVVHDGHSTQMVSGKIRELGGGRSGGHIRKFPSQLISQHFPSRVPRGMELKF